MNRLSFGVGLFPTEPLPAMVHLLPEHAVCLTGTSSRNLAANSQVLAMLAQRLGRVAGCFRSREGRTISLPRSTLTGAAAKPTALPIPGTARKPSRPTPSGPESSIDVP